MVLQATDLGHGLETYPNLLPGLTLSYMDQLYMVEHTQRGMNRFRRVSTR